MLLGISNVTVMGEGSEEVLEITSLFLSFTEEGLALLLSVEVISAHFVSVGKEKYGAREKSGCCSWCFYSIKEDISSVSWSSGFIARERLDVSSC